MLRIGRAGSRAPRPPRASRSCSRSSIAPIVRAGPTARRRRGSARRRRSRPAPFRPAARHGRCRAAAPGRRRRPYAGGDRRLDLLAAGADDDDLGGRRRAVDRRQQMQQHRPPGDRVKDLVQIGFHPRPLACGKDHCGESAIDPWLTLKSLFGDRPSHTGPCQHHSHHDIARSWLPFPLRPASLSISTARWSTRDPTWPPRSTTPWSSSAGRRCRRRACGMMVGHGARKLLERGLAASGEVTPALIDRGFPALPRLLCRPYLRRHSVPFDGIERALDALAGARRPPGDLHQQARGA